MSRYYWQQPFLARTRRTRTILTNTVFVAEACLRHITYQKLFFKHSRRGWRGQPFLFLYPFLCKKQCRRHNPATNLVKNVNNLVKKVKSRAHEDTTFKLMQKMNNDCSVKLQHQVIFVVIGTRICSPAVVSSIFWFRLFTSRSVTTR